MADKTLKNPVESLSQDNDITQQINVVQINLEESPDITQEKLSFNIFSSAIAISNLIFLVPKFFFTNTAQELKINWLFIRRDNDGLFGVAHIPLSNWKTCNFPC